MYEYNVEVLTVKSSGQKTTFPVYSIKAKDEFDLQVQIKEFAIQYYEEEIAISFDEAKFNKFYETSFHWTITNSVPINFPS
jgi:hypothetical protein